jgi:hypothetical protein
VTEHSALQPRLTAVGLGLVLAVLLVGIATALDSGPKPIRAAPRPTVQPVSGPGQSVVSVAQPAGSPSGPGSPAAPGSCSANTLAALGPASTNLPGAVASRRAEIAAAALACDAERLASYAGPRFLAGFENLAPVEQWRKAEANGDDPLRFLVLILGTTPGVVTIDDGRQLYVWPAAITHPSWDEVTDEERQALATVYPREELAKFEQLGRYVGYRTGITEGGEWQFLVTGRP